MLRYGVRSAMARQIPHNPEAEEAILGGALYRVDETLAIAEDLQASDFYRPAHAAVWQAILDLRDEGKMPEILLVVDRARNYGFQEDPSYLLGLMGQALPVRRETVELVLKASAQREVLRLAAEATREVYAGADPWNVSEGLQRNLEGLGSIRPQGPENTTFEDFLATAEDDGEWLIPDVITRDSLVLVVAAEGMGKATLMRMIGMCAAQGVDPFTHYLIPPVRTLYADFENPKRNIEHPANNLRMTLMDMRGSTYDPDRFRLWRRRRGINVLRHRDRGDFEREIADARPDLLMIGPLNRFHHKVDYRQSYEDTAGDVIDILARIREKFHCAIIIEHHAPKDRKPVTPFGSQRWMGDPDIGIVLVPEDDPHTVTVERFRGDRFDVKWPNHLVRDEHWVFHGRYDS